MNEHTLEQAVRVLDDQLAAMRELADTLDRLTVWIEGGDPFPEDET